MGEYSTDRGGLARRKDGSSKALKPNEVAMVERMKAMRDVPSPAVPRIETVVEVTPEGPVTVTRPFAPDVEAIKELDAKTNRYARETRSDPA